MYSPPRLFSIEASDSAEASGILIYIYGAINGRLGAYQRRWILDRVEDDRRGRGKLCKPDSGVFEWNGADAVRSPATAGGGALLQGGG